MKRATLILTDSGGVQEEAPALGKPVLVLRSASERPEAVNAGSALLVGHDPIRIIKETCRIMGRPAEARRFSPLSSPFGDGRASLRIAAAIAALPGFARGGRVAG
jgi:UDP-N-acetylglucosamine 2-epimerase (non-hydrolysing)